MDDGVTCQSCQYLTLALQRPAACERHAQRPASAGATAGAGGQPAFTLRELARLQALRAHVRACMAAGGRPDDVPAEAWRRSEA